MLVQEYSGPEKGNGSLILCVLTQMDPFCAY